MSDFKAFRRPGVSPVAVSVCVGVLCAGAGAYFFLRFLALRQNELLFKSAQCLALACLCALPRVLKLEESPAAVCFAVLLFCGGMVGSVAELFAAVPFYDILIHAFSGVVCVVFLRDYLQNRGLRLSKSVFFAAAMMLVIAVAALWEGYEFVVFTIFKEPSRSLALLMGELAGKNTDVGALFGEKMNIYAAFAAQTALSERFDTFSDVMSAVLAGAVSAAVSKPPS